MAELLSYSSLLGWLIPPFCHKFILHRFHWVISSSKKARTIFVVAEQYLLTPLKGGSAPQKVEIQKSCNFMMWVP
jgi:hypothetical protein